MNVLIVEDEDPAARRLERLVRAHEGFAACQVTVAQTLGAARDALARNVIDLVLLDLDLSGADGIALAKPNAAYRVIVVSGRTERAIDAFDHAVVDFVTKPVEAARLSRALERATAERPAAGPGRLAVRSAGRIDLVDFNDIVALSGADDYVEILVTDGRRYLHDSPLKTLEGRLPRSFLRVHRSHIVNTAHVRGLQTEPGGRRAVELVTQTKIPVSRSHAALVMKALA